MVLVPAGELVRELFGVELGVRERPLPVFSFFLGSSSGSFFTSTVAASFFDSNSLFESRTFRSGFSCDAISSFFL